MTTSGTAPIACTLTAGDFKARMDRIRDLTSESLLAHHRDGLALHLTYAPEAAERVQELVEKEQACCAFLSFDLRTDAHAVCLTVTAPEEAKDVADLLFAEFAPTPAVIRAECDAPTSSDVRCGRGTQGTAL
jgi:hypothetical protein